MALLQKDILRDGQAVGHDPTAAARGSWHGRSGMPQPTGRAGLARANTFITVTKWHLVRRVHAPSKALPHGSRDACITVSDVATWNAGRHTRNRQPARASSASAKTPSKPKMRKTTPRRRGLLQTSRNCRTRPYCQERKDANSQGSRRQRRQRLELPVQ
jgi:hypothetical protein